LALTPTLVLGLNNGRTHPQSPDKTPTKGIELCL
jgi:hypothetical protein